MRNRFRQESLDIEIKLGTKDWSTRFNLSVFEMNVVNVWLAHQCITRMVETLAGFYNYIYEEVIYNTYYRFIMRSAEGRRRNIVESDDKTFDDDNPLFSRINAAPIFGTALHVTPTNKRKKKRNGTETQHLLQGNCEV